jgi:hypothetical protein
MVLLRGMTNQAPPATRPHLQARLLARLIGAIYGITEALVPIVQAVTSKPVHPWQERMRYSNRFWAIIRELLALTIRIQPGTLSDNPVFPPIRPRKPRPAAPAPTREVPPLPQSPFTPPAYHSAPITPRKLAQRLALLLHQLECLAAEAGAALTAPFHRHAALARTIAGCTVCPPAPPRTPRNARDRWSWERAG